MQKNFLIGIIALSFLSMVFIIISLLVFLTRGNKSSLINKKLLIGGFILTLTAMINSCTGQTTINNNGDDPIMCYKPAMNDRILLDNGLLGDSIQYNLSETNIISGTISNRQSDIFSFRLTKKDGEMIQSGNINALDGVFDEHNEEFNIEIDKSTPKGEYILYFYNISAEEQGLNIDAYLTQYNILILNN